MVLIQTHGSLVDERAERRREILLAKPNLTVDRMCYMYRHYSLGAAAALLEFYVPIGPNRYAAYELRQHTGASVRTFANSWEARCGTWVPAVSSTRTGSWSTNTDANAFVTGTPDTGGGTFYSSAGAGATMTFNLTGSALGLVCSGGTNNGYAIVEVDGDAFGTANLLPKVTHAMTEAGGGLYADADLGKTYIDMYGSTAIHYHELGIADNLSNGAHTLRLIVSGRKGTEASTNVSVRAVGAVGCDELQRPANGLKMLRFRPLNFMYSALSATTLVTNWSTSPSAGTVLMGENHIITDSGQLPFEVYTPDNLVVRNAAGEALTPDQGTWAASPEFTVTRGTELGVNSVPRARHYVTYRINAVDPMQLTATGRVLFLGAGYLHFAYVGMLPTFKSRYVFGNIYDRTDFNRALVGNTFLDDLDWVSGSSIETNVEGADTVALMSTNHDLVYMAHHPQPDISLRNFELSGPGHTILRRVAQTGGNPPPGGLKSYFTRVGNGFVEPTPAGYTFDYQVGWRVLRLPNAVELLG